jgi:murein DD-endopeptidase MepM/ murein hydrolase activator NlpD
LPVIRPVATVPGRAGDLEDAGATLRPPNLMSTTKLAALLAAITVLCCSLAVPAQAAGNTRQRRDAARAKRADLAKQLNTLRASDGQLQGALRSLNDQVTAETANAAAARQKVDAAAALESQAQGELASTERRMTGIRKAVVGRAVSTYIRPRDDVVVQETLSPSEASRREALLSQVLSNDQDLLDQLHALKQDLQLKQKAAKKARDIASARRREVDAKLQALHQARAEKARLAAAVAARIRDYAAEAEAQAAQESSLTALINSESRFVPGGSSAAGLIWPIRGTVTSGFGYRWGRLHAGIDIAAPTGTPIHAAKAGQVIFAGTMSGYGNAVIVDHGGGFSTLYAHQSRLGSSKGQVVNQGDVIGYVGSTGHSTGPHLHFETRVNGSARDPRPYLP